MKVEEMIKDFRWLIKMYDKDELNDDEIMAELFTLIMERKKQKSKQT